MQLQFTEATLGTQGYGRVLMLRVIGDDHYRRFRQQWIGLELYENLGSVGVVTIELAIDQHQVDGLLTKKFERIGGGMRLVDFDVKVPGEQAFDTGMVGSTIPHIQYFANRHVNSQFEFFRSGSRQDFRPDCGNSLADSQFEFIDDSLGWADWCQAEVCDGVSEVLWPSQPLVAAVKTIPLEKASRIRAIANSSFFFFIAMWFRVKI